jgi:hypothetical protein
MYCEKKTKMNNESLNDDIFEMVKASLSGEGIDKTLFTKICTGQANEKEISYFSEKVGIENDTDVFQKLIDSCKLGFNMASQLDHSDTSSKNGEVAELREKVLKLEERVNLLEDMVKENMIKNTNKNDQ